MTSAGTHRDFFELDKKELVDMVKNLLQECDERHAHEDALEEQVKTLGAVPISFSETSPFPSDPAKLMFEFE